MPALPLLAAALLAAGPAPAPAAAPGCRPPAGVEAAVTRILVTATSVDVSYRIVNGSPAPAWIASPGLAGGGAARPYVERAGDSLLVASLLVPAPPARGAHPAAVPFRRLAPGAAAEASLRLPIPLATRARGAAPDRSRIDLDLVRRLRLELGALACPALGEEAPAVAPDAPCDLAPGGGPARDALACQAVVAAERGFPWSRSSERPAAAAPQPDPYAVPTPFLPANLEVSGVERGTCPGCPPEPDPARCRALDLTPEQVRVLLVRSIEMAPGALAQGRRRTSCALTGTVTWRDAEGVRTAPFAVSSVLSTTLRLPGGRVQVLGCDAWCATQVERAAPRPSPPYAR